MSGAPKVTIAGAGALGLSTALALADAGCAVTVCDPGGVNASAVAAGMLAPVFEAVLDPEARPHLDLLMTARDLWPAFAERAGIALDRSGALAVGDGAWLATVAAGLGGLGRRPLEIPGSTARGLAPGMNPLFDHALLSRDDWRIEPQAAIVALRRADVTFRPNRVTGRGDADVLVVATGAAADLAPELGVLEPIKGHIVRFAGPAFGACVRTDGAYAAPGAANLAVGATMEVGRSDAAIDPAAAEPLAAAGRRLFPHLTDAPFEIAAGIRAATPDGLPMVGPSATPGVILAVGARRNGWLLAPLVARMVTAYVTGRDAGRYAAQFDPGRFGA